MLEVAGYICDSPASHSETVDKLRPDRPLGSNGDSLFAENDRSPRRSLEPISHLCFNSTAPPKKAGKLVKTQAILIPWSVWEKKTFISQV